MFKSYEQFKAADRRLRKAGGKISDLFVGHVYRAVDYFLLDKNEEGSSNYNIQIMNDILDTATRLRLPRNRIIDWLSPVVGHVVIKGEGGVFSFAGKREDTDYAVNRSNAMTHFEKFRDWNAFKPEQAPEAFEPVKHFDKLKKSLAKQIKTAHEAGANVYAGLLESMLQELQTHSEVEVSVIDLPSDEKAEESPATAAA